MRVALTFDAEHPDRPTVPGGADSILDTLGRTGTKATFFIQGRWAEAYPRLVQRIAADGHVVGNHSFYHARMPLLSDEGFLTDVRDADQVIRRFTGRNPAPFFRCPFGEGFDQERTARLLARAGYRNIHWNVEPNDWYVSMTSPRLARAVVDETLAHGDGALVLLHTWPRSTFRALPQIVEQLAAAGATFVGVDELPDPVTG